jgi:clan AA aspartic protease (TIGR02281 family)
MKKNKLILFILFTNLIIYGQQIKTNYSSAIYSTPYYSWKDFGTKEPEKILNIEENTLVTPIEFNLIGDETNYVGDLKVKYNGSEGWMSSIIFNTDEIRKVKLIDNKNYQIKTNPTVIENKKKETSTIVSTNNKKVNSSSNNSNVIQMQKNYGGTFTIPCKINNLSLKFIFDTGASDVSISLTEALFMLKNGYLNKDDIIGKEYYSIANGDITEGTTINIKKLEFGNFTLYNVKASISNELKAPLLLGQSALSKLGKILIDYNLGTLTIIK